MERRDRNKIDLGNYPIDSNGYLFYPKNYPPHLPERNDTIYLEIEKFKKYEYTNNIAYEMLIRSEEYKKLIKVPLKNRDDVWKEEIRELGLDPLSIIGLLDNPMYWFSYSYFANPDYQIFFKDLSSFTIGDIKDGLKRIIEFYIEKNEIYSIDISKKQLFKGSHAMKRVLQSIQPVEYKLERNLTLRKVLENKKSYYIPCRAIGSKSGDASDETKYVINQALPLEVLQKDFLETIKEEIPLNKNRKLYNIFSRPFLRLKESNVVDISLNLDLPQEELLDYVKKLKSQYVSAPASITSINEFIESIQSINTQKLTKQEVKLEKSKKFIADAFFCYDYYIAAKEQVESKNREIDSENMESYALQEKLEEIEKLKKSKEIYDKTSQIAKLQKEIEEDGIIIQNIPLPAINKTSKNYTFAEEWFGYSKINKDTAYGYYTFIKDFIENQEYKQLISSIKK